MPFPTSTFGSKFSETSCSLQIHHAAPFLGWPSLWIHFPQPSFENCASKFGMENLKGIERKRTLEQHGDYFLRVEDAVWKRLVFDLKQWKKKKVLRHGLPRYPSDSQHQMSVHNPQNFADALPVTAKCVPRLAQHMKASLGCENDLTIQTAPTSVMFCRPCLHTLKDARK